MLLDPDVQQPTNCHFFRYYGDMWFFRYYGDMWFFSRYSEDMRFFRYSEKMWFSPDILRICEAGSECIIVSATCDKIASALYTNIAQEHTYKNIIKLLRYKYFIYKIS